MIDDNSPQLGGQDRDNAPMISGRGTKIIADARGAYLAGNLRGLIEHLDAEKLLLYKQAVIGEGLAILRARLQEDVKLADVIAEAERWLQDPSEDNRLRIMDRMNTLNLYDPSELARYRLLYMVARPEPLDHGLFYAMLDGVHSAYAIALIDRLTRWQLDAVWALITGRSIPPAEADPAGIHALMADAEHWYRKSNVQMLIRLLTDDQRERLKHAIREQMLWDVQQFPADQWPEDFRAWILASRGWLTHPETLDPALNRKMLRKIPDQHRSNRWFALIDSLIHTFEDQTLIDDLDFPYLTHAVTVYSYVAHPHGLYPVAEPHFAYCRVRETVWALLNDLPLPALDDKSMCEEELDAWVNSFAEAIDDTGGDRDDQGSS